MLRPTSYNNAKNNRGQSKENKNNYPTVKLSVGDEEDSKSSDNIKDDITNKPKPKAEYITSKDLKDEDFYSDPSMS